MVFGGPLYRSEETKACTVYIKGEKTLGLLTLLKDASSQDKKKKCPCNLGVKSSLRVSGEIGNCKSVTPCLQKFQNLSLAVCFRTYGP